MISPIRFLVFLFSASCLWAEPLVIHEWGTFTVLQDEKGAAIRGINTDDEPVPPFVHRAASIIRPPGEAALWTKGVIPCHPDVLMRMETPVVYFYPPGDKTMNLDLTVEFAGGWITEFYPMAKVEAPGLDKWHLAPECRGRLEWKNLRVGGKAAGPETDSLVWKAPRAVDATSVTASDGETERFLFYRGVANLAAPLSVVRDGACLRIENKSSDKPKKAWLVDIQPGGKTAFREVSLETDEAPTIPAEFAKDAFSVENLAGLRQSMREALVVDGLFPKEADAMLATWDKSYFKSSGTRLFYLVPKAWTEAHLPMKVSAEAEISRVMVGRIEIVTPYQRQMLKILAGRSKPWRMDDLPAAYHLLGRFANALILEDLRRGENENLRELASNLGLGQP